MCASHSMECCSPELHFPLLKACVCYCTLVILAPGEQRGQEFKVILSYLVSGRPTWATWNTMWEKEDRYRREKGEVLEWNGRQQAFPSEHCLICVLGQYTNNPGLCFLLTSSSLGQYSGDAGRGLFVLFYFVFFSYPDSQMFSCQDFLQHSLEASDKLDFVWGFGGWGGNHLLLKTLLQLILAVLRD